MAKYQFLFIIIVGLRIEEIFLKKRELLLFLKGS